jgi:hypothetical protein
MHTMPMHPLSSLDAHRSLISVSASVSVWCPLLQAQSLVRQLELSETECGRLQEALRTAAARASQQQAELAAQQDALQTAARRAEALQVSCGNSWSRFHHLVTSTGHLQHTM